jgi:hypothetical protein
MGKVGGGLAEVAKQRAATLGAVRQTVGGSQATGILI